MGFVLAGFFVMILIHNWDITSEVLTLYFGKRY